MLNTTNSFLLQTMLILLNKNLQNTENAIQSDMNVTSTKEYCYEPFGCYKMSYPWSDEILRPVSFTPQSPEVLNPKYCLFTRNNKNNCQLLDILNKDSLLQTSMASYHRFYIISHGFMEYSNKEWITEMTRELLKLSDSSVIVVDWSSGCGPPYPQAVANIRLLGDMTAYLINSIIEDIGVQPHLIHFIGHGLGAHMAAYTGQTLESNFGYKLGRITGLDPAEPHFSKTDPIVRLDPTDADFVDVIHTDGGLFISGGLGILQPIGHVDYYPNGGVEQPGCKEGVMSYMSKNSGSFYRGIKQMIGCNHVRSYQYFTESINPRLCQFMGTECGSWEEFENGSCFECSADDKCPFQNKFGLHSDSYLRKGAAYGSPLRLPPPRSQVKLFLKTGREEPFCRHHFQIKWTISNSCKSLQHGGEIGMITVTIQGEKGTTKDIQLSEEIQYYEPGSQHHVIIAGEPIGKLQSAVLRWQYRTNPLNPLTWRFTSTPRIYISWLEIKSIEEKDSLSICHDNDVPITSRRPLILKKEDREDKRKCNLEQKDCKDID